MLTNRIRCQLFTLHKMRDMSWKYENKKIVRCFSNQCISDIHCRSYNIEVNLNNLQIRKNYYVK